jgi:hypothetical protein
MAEMPREIQNIVMNVLMTHDQLEYPSWEGAAAHHEEDLAKLFVWLEAEAMAAMPRASGVLVEVPATLGQVTGIKSERGKLVIETDSGTPMIAPMPPAGDE